MKKKWLEEIRMTNILNMTGASINKRFKICEIFYTIILITTIIKKNFYFSNSLIFSNIVSAISL